MCPFPRTCCTSLDPRSQSFSALPTLKLHSHSVARFPCNVLWINHPQLPQLFLPPYFLLPLGSLHPPPWEIWGSHPSPIVLQVWPPCFTSLEGSRPSSHPWEVGDYGLCLMGGIPIRWAQTFPVAVGRQDLIPL